MKNLFFLFIIGALTLSCSIQKRHYLNGFYTHHKNKVKSSENIGFTQIDIPISKINTIIPKHQEPFLVASAVSEIKVPVKRIEDCDLIILKNGEEIKCKVLEITLNEIKYKRCDNQMGPTISIGKNEVFMIKYPNGTKDIITKIDVNNSSNDENKQPIDKSKLQTNKAAVFGFVMTIAGIIFNIILTLSGIVFPVFSVCIALLGLIFSAIGLAKISNNPTKFKGKGLAIAGLILGILLTIGAGYILLIYT